MRLFWNLEVLIYLDVVNEWLVSLPIKGEKEELTIFEYLLYAHILLNDLYAVFNSYKSVSFVLLLFMVSVV